MTGDNAGLVLAAAALVGLGLGFGLVVGAFVARYLRRYMRNDGTMRDDDER